MSETPTIIRVSSLTGYPDCNRRGAARLFWRQIKNAGFTLNRTARGIGATIGTAVHQAAAVTLNEKARGGKLPPVTVAEDAGHEMLTLDLKSSEVVFDNTTHSVTEAREQLRHMVRAYHHTVAPQVNPLIVEERFEAELAPGILLSGQPDQIAREPHSVRDLKTGTRQQSYAPQLGGYSLLARSNGLAIERAVIDFVGRARITKPQPDPVSTSVDVARAETAAANIVGHMLADLDTFQHGNPERRIRPGDPWAFQANPSSILCSAKFCPAFGTEFCREGKTR